MSIINDYYDAMSIVRKAEHDSSCSAETKYFIDLIRAVDNYHRETQKRADRLQADLTAAKGELAGTPLKLRPADPNNELGWTLDLDQVTKVHALARAIENMYLEETEAVMIAMVEARFAHTIDRGNAQSSDISLYESALKEANRED